MSLADDYAQAQAALSASASSPNPVTGLPDLVDQPWVNPPPGHQDFSFPFVMALPAAASPETTITDANGNPGFTVPIGWGGAVVKFLSCWTNVVGFVDGSGSIIWRVRLNQNAYVKNYDQIQVRLGSIPTFPGDTNIVLSPGDFLEWRVQNISQAGGVAQVVGFFRGWYWPVTS